jgi:hypothetical protein
VCSVCQARGSACVYKSHHESETRAIARRREHDTLKRNLDSLETLISNLRNAPENFANEILERLRNSSSIDSVLSTLGPDIHCTHLSEHKAALAYLPPVYSHQELELMVQHPRVYPALDPQYDEMLWRSSGMSRAKKTKLGDMQELVNENLHSSHSSISINKSRILGAGPIHISDQPNFESTTSGAHLDTSTSEHQVGTQPMKGYFNAQLSQVNISRWTCVPISNEFAAEAISLYLDTDHPFLGLFDAELFVGALVEGSSDFCSSFLVSSLLAFASVGSCSISPFNNLESNAELIIFSKRILL